MKNKDLLTTMELRKEEYKVLQQLSENGKPGTLTLPVIDIENIGAFEGVAINLDAKNRNLCAQLEYAHQHEGIVAVFFTEGEIGPIKLRHEMLCICRLDNYKQYSPNHIKTILMGLMPAKLVKSFLLEGIEMATIEFRPYSTEPMNDEEKQLLFEAKQKLSDLTQLSSREANMLPKEIWDNDDINDFVNLIIPGLQLKPDEVKFFLDETDRTARIKRLIELLDLSMGRVAVKGEIEKKVQDNLEKNQKEMLLREQLRVINKELDGEVDEMEKMQQQLKEKKMPKDIEEYSLKELARLKKMPFGSPEIGYIRNFLETILELPFNEKTTDSVNLEQAKEILNADHYGLEDVKERIVEYLAVLKKTHNLSGQILCFVGPPGIGKTSIVRSIAKAVGRNFVQMSLGGVSDESLIRGHSRTYVGSRPGRIIMGMKKAKSVNPVFLLDEVDKMAHDMRGDPAAALLEVLDPEQNMHFKDTFLEVEYDLSQVLFVATANDKSQIPIPLLDRMEIVELTTYTEDEKLEIVKRHILPKEIQKNGLSPENIKIDDDTIRMVITDYCVESGVRDLERKIAQICRKVVVNIDEGKGQQFVITKDDLVDYLGAKIVPMLDIYKGGNVGEAVGLAWTQVGGTALLIEVATCEGTGKIKYTGKLGDVFKESVELAMSVVRSRAKKYGIDPEIFKKTDVHIHLPEMAIGKDGPSAGITLTTAIMSAFTNRAVKPRFVMTGEISLLGRVLPIGGLKEKMLAGIKVGATELIIPETNKTDYEKNKNLVEGKLNVHFVSNIDEVLSLILEYKHN